MLDDPEQGHAFDCGAFPRRFSTVAHPRCGMSKRDVCYSRVGCTWACETVVTPGVRRRGGLSVAPHPVDVPVLAAQAAAIRLEAGLDLVPVNRVEDPVDAGADLRLEHGAQVWRGVPA